MVKNDVVNSALPHVNKVYEVSKKRTTTINDKWHKIKVLQTKIKTRSHALK